MNNRCVLKNNRGAALVSIMVAVAFVTILATAILSMSYNNFRMKVVNYESKANFYETEQRLTMMSTTLRNNVMSSSTPLTEIKTLTGVPDGGDRYRADKVAALAFPGTTPSQGENSSSVVGPNGDTFYFTAQAGANYEEADQGAGLKKITLKGVTIRQVESRTKNENTIKTDLVMYIRESDAPAAIGGIGEFSVLSDAPLSSDIDYGTRINMFGNAFFMGMDFKGDHTAPGTVADGKAALVLSGNCVYNVLGDYNFAYGDIVLNENASLNIIGGSLTVYGNIYLNGNSTLTCTGRLYMPCAEKGSYDVTAVNEAKQIYPAGLTSNIVRIDADKCDNLLNALKLNDNTADNDGITAQILEDQTVVDDASGTQYYFDDTVILPQAEEYTTAQAVTINGISYSTSFTNKSDINDTMGNKLVFLGSGVNIVESNENSTFISRAPIKFAQVHSVNLSKMGSYAFNYLTLTESGAKTNYKYVEGIHEISMKDGKTFCVGGFLDADANDTVKAIMGYAVNGSGGQPSYSSTIGYQNWSKE